jgi:lipoprotein-anchoring transpeptidase ErfK/SrfK
MAEPARPAMDPRFAPQVVSYDGKERPGTIIIDTPRRFLFLVQENGKAMRYGIGVGKPGFTWAGVKTITRKAEWPDWVPPPEMLKRRPELPRHMAGGPDNPLGARAMYLGSSLYRIHGSNEPWTIGQAVSSGCIRMRNEDVIDLYGRVKVGTRVIVL